MPEQPKTLTPHEQAIVKLCDVILARVAHDEQGPANPDVLLAAVHVHKLELECLREVLFGSAFGVEAKPSRAQLERAFETIFEKRVAEECERYRVPAIFLPRH